MFSKHPKQGFRLRTASKPKASGTMTVALLALACLALAACDRTANSVVPTEAPHAEGTVNSPTLDSIKGSPWENLAYDTTLKYTVSTKAYDSSLRVHFSTITQGASLHYTLDGSLPTARSPVYSVSGVRVDSSLTLKVIATRAGWNASEVLAKSFEFHAKPVLIQGPILYPWTHSANSTRFTPVYDRPIAVILHGQEPGIDIHFTLDGSTPTNRSKLYKDSVVIDSTRTLTAVATKAGWKDSDPESFSVILQAQPVVMGAGGGSIPPFRIGMSSPTPGVVIRYTSDSSSPTRSSKLYTDSLPFGRYDFAVNYAAIAVDTLHPKISPSAPARMKFDQLDPWNAAIPYGSITDDRDGRVYRTVVIGSQTWMAENLGYKIDSSWCPQDIQSYCESFGRLYAWTFSMALPDQFKAKTWAPTAVRRGLCPTNFHMPNDTDWSKLFETVEANPLVGAGRAGMALVSAKNGGWSWSGTYDIYGFRGVSAGWHHPYNSSDIQNSAYFQSFTQSKSYPDRAMYWSLQNQSSGYGHYELAKVIGLSIRCLENK